MNTNNIKKRDLTDFPFEDVPIKNWIFSLVISIGGFFYISFGAYTIPKFLINEYTISFLFLFFCFMSLYILDHKFFSKLFKKVKLKDLGIIALTIILSYALAIISSIGKVGLVENPITEIINKDNIVKIFVITAIQLIGEEVLFVIPFLFVYNILKNKTNKKLAILLAWIISSLIFGMLHLPTYSFNLYQAFIVIGAVRMGMSLSYLWTKNLTVSYIAHVLYDFIILFGVYAASQYLPII